MVFLKNYILKDTLNILFLLFCISFFLVLSKWIYDKKHKFFQYIFIILPLLLLTYVSFSLDVWAEREHFIQYGLLGMLVSRAYKISSFKILLASGLFFDVLARSFRSILRSLGKLPQCSQR